MGRCPQVYVSVDGFEKTTVNLKHHLMEGDYLAELVLWSPPMEWSVSNYTLSGKIMLEGIGFQSPRVCN